MTYLFKFKRFGRIFYRRAEVIGHAYTKELDRMTLFLPNGGIYEVCQWSLCDCKLGPDWVLAKKKDMESKAGQAIPVNRNLDAN